MSTQQPMTEAQIYCAWDGAGSPLPLDQFTRLVRAVEAHHGIATPGVPEVDPLAVIDKALAAIDKAMAARTPPEKPPQGNMTAEWPARGVKETRRPLGCALAMRVMQSDLYPQLDEVERADCDELVRQNLEWFKADASGVDVPRGGER